MNGRFWDDEHTAYCTNCEQAWTDHGCPVAVAAADAAVDADRPSIQAQAAAEVGDKFAEWSQKAEVEPKIDWAWFGEIVRWTGSLKHEANRLRADRIEAQP